MMKTYIITKNDLKDVQHMRNVRNHACFQIINRGKLWYDQLTQEQLLQLRKWYQEWLDFPQTLIVPIAPEWLDVDYQIQSEREE